MWRKIFIGARPTRNRDINSQTLKDKDNPSAESLPMLFKNIGYTTISKGKIYCHAKDDSLAWDEQWSPEVKYKYAMVEYQ
jgi:hypothetical protein